VADPSDISDPSKMSGTSDPPFPPADQRGVRFTGAYRLTTGPHGPMAVPGFQIELGEQGITAVRAQGAAGKDHGETSTGPGGPVDLGGPTGSQVPGSPAGPDGPDRPAGPDDPDRPAGPDGPDGPAEPAWVAPWPSIATLDTSGRSILPDGRTGLVLVVGTRARGRHQSEPHRFVLATDRPEQVEADLATLAAAHGLSTAADPAGPSGPAQPENSRSPDGAGRRSRSSRMASRAEDGSDPSPPIWVVALAMPAAAAVVAVLLLAAGHQVHL
jgi:hypothetical protein